MNVISEGDIALDVVFPRAANQKNAPRVIRSMFRVTEKSGDILKFDFYWFLDESWKEGILTDRVWRQTESLDSEDAEKLLSSVRNSDSYRRYSSGEKPESIDEEEWDRMVERAQEVIGSDSKGYACANTGSC